MLVVDYNEFDETPHCRSFHSGVGPIFEVVSRHFGDGASLIVQADGDELEKIRKNFTSLPMTNARVVRWHGDFAKFIVANIAL